MLLALDKWCGVVDINGRPHSFPSARVVHQQTRSLLRDLQSDQKLRNSKSFTPFLKPFEVVRPPLKSFKVTLKCREVTSTLQFFRDISRFTFSFGTLANKHIYWVRALCKLRSMGNKTVGGRVGGCAAPCPRVGNESVIV